MTLDRWGDSTHQMNAYNNRHRPSYRDQRQIDRMEAENMVLYPAPVPNPVLPPAPTLGRRIYPGEVRGLNWRAENLRRPNPGFHDFPAMIQEPQNPDGYYRRLPTPGSSGRTRRRGNRKSPSRRPHRRVPYPPSPQYRPPSSSDEEAGPSQRRRGDITHPNPTPRPVDSDGDMSENNHGFSMPPEEVEGPQSTQQSHTTLCQELDKVLEKALGPQQALEKGEAEVPQPSTSGGQGGGDREPTPGPQDSLRPKLNLASETWSLVPNKVRFMDEPDTYRANVGRHHEKSPRLMRAKTFPHLVFATPQPPLIGKTVPDRRELPATPQGTPPGTHQTPQLLMKVLPWGCQRPSLSLWSQKWW